MIVKMKKVTLLCVEHAREKALEALRNLGVMHVTPIVPPAGQPLEEARARVEQLKRVLAALADATGAATEPSGKSADVVENEVLALLAARQQQEEQLEKVKAEIRRIEAFGSFQPEDVRALAAKGIYLKLYFVPGKDVPALPEAVSSVACGSSKTGSFWALYATYDFEWAGAEEQKLPALPLDELRRRMLDLMDEQVKGAAALQAYAPERRALQKRLVQLEGEKEVQEVCAGMAAQERIAFLQGFVPAGDVEGIREKAAAEGWGLVVEDPGPQDDVPVKLHAPRWARPINAVFKGINILPGYAEADVSAVFMFFFCIFFAMIVGDMGYGAIFLGLTLYFRKKMPKDAAQLLMVTSICTIIWGLITGTFFGMSSEILEKIGLAKFQVPFLTNENSARNLMGLCFLIGAIQITVGHVWNVIDLAKEKSTKALEQLGWVFTTWFMFFLADNMVIASNMVSYIGKPAALVPFTGSFIDYVALVGIALIILFMMKPAEFKEGWFNMALLPLNLINNFTDVVSYVRLYAVGAAGFAVANAFNTMLFSGEISILRGVFSAVLLFAAHGLNILLCVMGVLVHGIRLNTLEFSNHKGISWSGTPYRPFAKPAVETGETGNI